MYRIPGQAAVFMHRALLLWHRALGAKASHPDQRFCRLCNFDLPNKQRFSLQRHKTAKSYTFCGSMSCDAELWFSGKGERTTREKFCVGFCFCLVTVIKPGWKRGETVIYAPFILVI